MSSNEHSKTDEQVSESLKGYRRLVQAEIQAQLNNFNGLSDERERKRHHLAQLIYHNQGQWSGGQLSINNIREQLINEQAAAMLYAMTAEDLMRV